MTAGDAHSRVSGSSGPSVGGSAVLVVDDDSAVRMLVARALESSGYAVIVAGDGAQALELLERRGAGIHLVLTDIQMPRLGGLELGRELAARQFHIPILYMSSDPPDELMDGNVLSQPACLQKPFTIRTLITRVRQVFPDSTLLEQETL
jgi:two-component system, cell cycle sensor histidine kinase and response regulator CckA